MKEKTITPLGDRVLIKPLEASKEVKTASGIILTSKEANKEHERGTVAAVGTGRTAQDGVRIPMNVKVGDIVLFKRGYNLDILDLNGVEVLMLSEGDLLAVES